MEERRWIWVDQLEYDRPGEIGMSADVDADIFISPFEIPKGVRGYYDDARRRFVIEFEYITRERTKNKDFGPPGVTTVVGRKTGRIRGFEVDVDVLDTSSASPLLTAVRKALVAAREKAEPPHPDPWSRIELNSHVADRILQDRQSEVFAPAGR